MLESELLEEIQSIFSRGEDKNLIVPNGDDGAVFFSEKQIVVSADVAVSGIHFKENWSSKFEIGRKITAANLADICAMGGWPKYLIATLVLPAEEGVLDLARGIAKEADLVGARVIGGDLSVGKELSISVTAIGETTWPITRSGAKVGDRVFVSSLPGGSAAGLHLLKSNIDLDSKFKEDLVAQHKAPTIDYFKYQSAFKNLNAAIDISDGLLIDASHIAKSSNVRINLNRKILEKSELQNLDKELYMDWVLRGGEDHILLCTSSKSIPDFIEIGVVEDGNGIAIDGAEIDIGGYIHQWQN